jgi:hypothetical protein
VYNLIWLHISAERVMLCFSVFPFFFLWMKNWVLKISCDFSSWTAFQFRSDSRTHDLATT